MVAGRLRRSTLNLVLLQATVSSPTIPPDSKRPRLHSGSNTQSEKLGLKLSGRIPHLVLEECLKCTENGDKLGWILSFLLFFKILLILLFFLTDSSVICFSFRIFSRLREFFGEHLSVLSADSQVYCAKLLIQIAAASRIAATTNTCLLYALHICKSSDMKQNIWNEIVILMADDKDKKETRYVPNEF